MPTTNVNILAVVVAAVATFLLGAVWYSPVLFAKQWVHAHGYTPEKVEEMKKKGVTRAYAVAAVCYLVMAYVLALLASYTQATSLAQGLWLGFLVWLGFAATLGRTANGVQLARTLRLKDLIFIVVGTVIGSGIFTVPGPVLRQTGGHIGFALLAWVLGGIVSLLGALTYGELGGMLPEAGGAYVYVREAFGRLPAFLLGWTLFFVVSTGSVATLSVAFAEYLRQFVPLGPSAGKLVAALMIAVVGAVNVRGTRHSASLQNWSTGIKVGAILVMSAVFLGTGHGLAGGRAAELATPPLLSPLSGIGVAMIGVLWAYEGWANVAASAGETLEPQRAFPRGIVIGTVALVAIYLLANAGYLAALGPAGVAQSDRVAAEAVTALHGPGAGRLIAAAVLVSMFSAANGLTLTNSRVYYAMARDGVFFRKLADVHPRFGTPAFSVIVSSAWTVLLAATGSFEPLFTYE